MRAIDPVQQGFIPHGAPSATSASDSNPAFSWTGFSVGLTGGARWNKVGWQTTSIGDPRLAPFALTSKRNLDSAGPRGGLYAAYDMQFRRFVLGVEAEVGYGRERRGTKGIPGAPNGVAWAGDRFGTDVSLDGSLRLRAGFLARPHVMLYVTGGPALQRSTLRLRCDGLGASACGSPQSQSVTRMRRGWTVGAGFETQLGRGWMARFEYRLTHVATPGQTFFAPSATDTVAVRGRSYSNVVSVGLGYRF